MIIKILFNKVLYNAYKVVNLFLWIIRSETKISFSVPNNYCGSCQINQKQPPTHKPSQCVKCSSAAVKNFDTIEAVHEGLLNYSTPENAFSNF